MSYRVIQWAAGGMGRASEGVLDHLDLELIGAWVHSPNPPAHSANAVPHMCTAQAGLLTSMDVPVVAGRASLRLQRRRPRTRNGTTG
jgi:hypothetical protein